jgi:hypothetical protein
MSMWLQPRVLSTGGLIASVMVAATARADINVTSRGELGVEGRVFYPDDEAKTDAGNVAAIGRLQVDAEQDIVSARARAFTRLDPYDSARTRIVPEEIWLQGELSSMRLRAGFQMLNWSATEAFHPADVINSRILDGSFENPEKIGEPMVALRVEIPNGNVELMAMPVFTAPVLPSGRSRLGLAGPGIELGDALVLQRDGKVDDHRWQAQWAARVQQTWGNADVSLQAIEHIDRTMPLVVIDPVAFAVRPMYQSVLQLGGTYTHVFDQLIVKVEGSYNHFSQPKADMTMYGPVPKRDHVLAALGFEQGVSQTNGQETSFLLEGQALIPTRSDFPKLQYPLFEHDVLIGMRHAWNDEQSRSLLFTTIVDLHDPERVVIGSAYNQRLGEEWGLTVGLRFMRYPPKDPDAPVLYERLQDAHQLYFDLRRYF